MFKGKRKHDNSDKSDGPPSKKTGKPTILTPLNEQEAERLANDIYTIYLLSFVETPRKFIIANNKFTWCFHKT